MNIGLQPDFVWIKQRNATIENFIFDSVRGPGKSLSSDTASGDYTASNLLSSFNIDGFTLESSNFVNGTTSAPRNYVAWSWKAGGSKFTYNKDGSGGSSASDIGVSATTLTLTGASINTRSKFGIYTYTGSGSGGATLNHGLGGTPGLVIYKKRTGSSSWQVYHKSLGGTKYMNLDEDTDAYTSDSTRFGGTNPTSSTISLGTHANGATTTVLYAWCDVPGLQKFGSYTGVNSTNGPFLELGFRPAVIMFKNISSNSTGWVILDNKRDGFNGTGGNQILFPNTADPENSTQYGDFLSNGWKFRINSSYVNSTDTFIYAAWAEAPTFNLYGGQSNAR